VWGKEKRERERKREREKKVISWPIVIALLDIFVVLSSLLENSNKF